MTRPTLPVDVYIRVSRVGKRGDRLISPDEQERRARAHAAQHGLEIGSILPPDLDESGGRMDRPGLNEALRRVEAGESGGIIVAWLDRLSRDSEHAHALVRRIAEAGGVIYAPDAPADWTSPEGELQAGFVFLLATYVRKRARAGFARSREQAIARGIPVGPHVAVGYRKRSDRRLEPDPRTAPIIREAFERRAAGESASRIAEFLESERVCTSTGSKTWTDQAVYAVLRNRTYLGELRSGEYVNPAGIESPIVDLALWMAAQSPQRRPAATGERRSYLLTGLIRCAGCGYAMQGTTSGRGRTPIYRCTRRHSFGGECPEPARVIAAAADATAADAFWSLVPDLQASASDDTADAVDSLQAVLDKAQVALQQYMAPEVQEAIGDPALWAHGLRERREARDRAAEALGRVRSRSTIVEPADVATLRETWDTGTLAERRELLAARFDCFALYREPLEIVAYPTGTAPEGLPRQGNRKPPRPRPFPERPASAQETAAA